MSDPSRSNAKTPVLVLGPAPDEVGGMAAVVAQSLQLDLGPRFRTELFVNTGAESGAESALSKARRHLRQSRRLAEMIRQCRAKLVHIHTCSGFSFYRSVADVHLARRLGCRVVLHVHGAAFDEFHRNGSAAGRWAIRRGLMRADRVIALSQQWRRKLAAMSPRARVTVIENAVALPTMGDRLPSDGKCRFVLLAKMDVWKGIDDLLTACAGLEDRDRRRLEITLAGPPGTAGDAAILADKIRRWNLQRTVRYAGPVLGEQKDALLRQADAYVQPSHHEGMPLSVLEAFSYGLPVVGTTVGAMPEIVEGTATGTLVPPRRPDALGAALVEMAADAGRRLAWGANARRLAEARFGLSRLQEDLVRLYTGVLAGNG